MDHVYALVIVIGSCVEKSFKPKPFWLGTENKVRVGGLALSMYSNTQVNGKTSLRCSKLLACVSGKNLYDLSMLKFTSFLFDECSLVIVLHKSVHDKQ